MGLSIKMTGGIFVVFAALILTTSAQAYQAHAHIGHVATAWGDTPDHQGLLQTAEGEAEIALAHAGYALSDVSDLAAIKMHTRHVMHALDPSSTDGGPGMGYGLFKAIDGTITHLGLAAKSEDASGAVKAHAGHISTAAGSVAELLPELEALTQGIMAAEDAEAAGTQARRIEELMQHIVNSEKGSLAQARLHMTLLLKAEGLE